MVNEGSAITAEVRVDLSIPFRGKIFITGNSATLVSSTSPSVIDFTVCGNEGLTYGVTPQQIVL